MIKGSEAQKQKPYELLWMLWFDEKSISNENTSGSWFLNESVDPEHLQMIKDNCELCNDLFCNGFKNLCRKKFAIIGAICKKWLHYIYDTLYTWV